MVEAKTLPETILVCMPHETGSAPLLPDNGVDVCRVCGGGVQFRPGNPARLAALGHSEFAFVCIICATALNRGDDTEH
jgi:hypothetical protein